MQFQFSLICLVKRHAHESHTHTRNYIAIQLSEWDSMTRGGSVVPEAGWEGIREQRIPRNCESWMLYAYQRLSKCYACICVWVCTTIDKQKAAATEKQSGIDRELAMHWMESEKVKDFCAKIERFEYKLFVISLPLNQWFSSFSSPPVQDINKIASICLQALSCLICSISW